MLNQALLEIRHLIAGLRPPQLDDAGVIAAIKTLIDESPETPETPQIEFQCDVRFKRLDPLAENAIFRIVQESLTNATRYSQSKTVKVSLTQTNGVIRLEIQDQGIGFQPTQVQSDRFGLNGIRERATVLGGHAVIRSAPGFGTRITVELPASLIAE
jgi:two-component system sensor histidine kinase NreB